MSSHSIAVLVAAAALLLPAGCSVGFTTSDSPPPPNVNGLQCDGSLCEYDAGAAEDTRGPSPDGGGGSDAAGSAYQGSPLCNYSKPNGCFPDLPAPAADCTTGVDAGAADAAGNTATYACHVSVANAQADPTQACSAAGPGHDGDACQRGGDCAAGFECVGSGQCRHYCCAASSCGTQGKSSFCDIQVMSSAPSPNTKVPVCMPVRSCKLLVPGYCEQGETCAVVKIDGTTSCVAVGPAKVGDACDKDHCAENLVCLGNVGQRKCYELCHTASTTECAGTQKCKGSAPMFPDPSVGICE